MDNTPDYLSALNTVAMVHGGMTDHTYLGTLLIAKWEDLETKAKAHHYDVFIHSTEDYSGLRRAMIDMVELLYRIPGAHWQEDTQTIRAKDTEYGGSWHRRGGPGAFFMLARKWDRIENQMKKHSGDLDTILEKDTRAEGIRDDLTDLRCYLLLVLSWHYARENLALTTQAVLPLAAHSPEEDALF